MIEALKDDSIFQIAGCRASDGGRSPSLVRRIEVRDPRRSINGIRDCLMILQLVGNGKERQRWSQKVHGDEIVMMPGKGEILKCPPAPP
jgi:hypothetical protein